MAGNIIHKVNMESGETWTLNSVAAKDVPTRNSRGFRTDTTYDLIQREVQGHVQQSTGPKALAIQTVYGDTQTNAEVKNLRTKVISVSDQSGTTTFTAYDYKGNLLSGTKTLVGAYSSIVDWSASTVPMEPGQYATIFTYDALNRTRTSTGPDGSIITNKYGIEGLLQTVQVNLQGTSRWQPVLLNVSYNAKGQRVLCTTNDKVKSVYTYDPLTFKMTDLVTSRNASIFPDDCPQPPVSGWPGCQVPSLHYTFDPIGNITNVRDDAQQTIFFQNKRVEPSSDYIYDSLYRLIEATGREHLGQTGVPTPYGPSTAGDAWQQSPRNGNAMGTYMEQYFLDNTTWNSYDSSGARIRKLTVGAAAAGAKPIATAERIYIGPFEVYRKFAANGTMANLERQSLHVMDAEDCITNTKQGLFLLVRKGLRKKFSIRCLQSTLLPFMALPSEGNC
ncbi:hypothetical protein LTS15_010986 [Exophiala xenobiotica]|nr:hypothetical protein LTS15_010986 [Exophiala xenobiotica]